MLNLQRFWEWVCISVSGLVALENFIKYIYFSNSQTYHFIIITNIIIITDIITIILFIQHLLSGKNWALSLHHIKPSRQHYGICIMTSILCEKKLKIRDDKLFGQSHVEPGFKSKSDSKSLSLKHCALRQLRKVIQTHTFFQNIHQQGHFKTQVPPGSLSHFSQVLSSAHL